MATNQQRREAAKRKLDRQLEHRAQRARRNRIIGVAATVAAVVVATGVVVFLANRGTGGNATAEQPKPEVKIPTERVEPAARPKALADPAECKYPKDAQPASKEVKAPENGAASSKGTVDVTFASTAGDIGLTLDRALAPCTVNSVISLIEQGYYEGTECHRLGTEGLQMLQCGDPTASGSGGPGYKFKDETFKQLKYGRGILAMANAGPDTGGSQFFVIYGRDGHDLDAQPNYTIFGDVVEGLDVARRIAEVPIQDPSAGLSGQQPTKAIYIEKVTIAFSM